MTIKGISFGKANKYLHNILGLKYSYSKSDNKDNKKDPLAIFKKVKRQRYTIDKDVPVYDEKSVIYKRIPPFCAIVKPLAAKNCRTALHRAAVRARNDQIRLRASSSPTSVKSGCICRMLAGTSGVTGPKNAFLTISALPAPFATMSTLRACMMVLMPMV